MKEGRKVWVEGKWRGGEGFLGIGFGCRGGRTNGAEGLTSQEVNERGTDQGTADGNDLRTLENDDEDGVDLCVEYQDILESLLAEEKLF